MERARVIDETIDKAKVNLAVGGFLSLYLVFHVLASFPRECRKAKMF